MFRPFRNFTHAPASMYFVHKSGEAIPNIGFAECHREGTSIQKLDDFYATDFIVLPVWHGECGMIKTSLLFHDAVGKVMTAHEYEKLQSSVWERQEGTTTEEPWRVGYAK